MDGDGQRGLPGDRHDRTGAARERVVANARTFPALLRHLDQQHAVTEPRHAWLHAPLVRNDGLLPGQVVTVATVPPPLGVECHHPLSVLFGQVAHDQQHLPVGPPVPADQDVLHGRRGGG